MGWCFGILARRAINWALMREARRRILRVSTMAVARCDVMVEATLSLVDAERTPGAELIGAGGDGVVHTGAPLGYAGRGQGAELHAVAIHAMVGCGRGAKCISDEARWVLGVLRYLSCPLALVGGVGRG